FEAASRRFKRTIEKTGLLTESRSREFYEKPTAERKRKHAAANLLIPESFIQELLARVDVVDVVGRYVQLRKGGASLLGSCPFHNEKSPSFTVSPTKQFYHCFGCGAHGSAITFSMEHTGASFPEAVRTLAASAGMTVPEENRSPRQQQETARRKAEESRHTQV
ncbi:hypothetical protein OY671_009983, partial [Metschnikowia pulcherrima]